eukprot:1121848-Alexandrium_andersonii.AAC.1
MGLLRAPAVASAKMAAEVAKGMLSGRSPTPVGERCGKRRSSKSVVVAAEPRSRSKSATAAPTGGGPPE